ncbi:MAG: 30S ribosomal protein S1 [Cellulosilyticaceae bacterium]
MNESSITMADLMDEVDKSMSRIYRGDILKATVALVEEKGIILNIGYHADGLLPWTEYSYDTFNEEDVQVGDEFEVMVTKIDDGEGNVLVSKRRAEAETALEDIEALYKEKAVFNVKVTDVVKGGVITVIKGIRAFIPGSQLSNTFVEDLSTFKGKEIEVEIIEFDAKAKKLVLSGKRLAKEKAQAAKNAKFDTLVEGEKYTGTVTKLMPYGAFVDLGGIEGLVHNTDLSWVRIKHPSEVVAEGQKIQVTLLNIDKDKRKIALRLKDIDMDPWYLETANLEVGQIVTGKVTKFMSFGAFVSIRENVEGLVHISQIVEDKRIGKPEEALELGQTVNVKILSIDKENKKISLSMTQVKEEVEEGMLQYMEEEDNISTVGDVLGDTFKNLFNK